MNSSVEILPFTASSYNFITSATFVPFEIALRAAIYWSSVRISPLSPPLLYNSCKAFPVYVFATVNKSASALLTILSASATTVTVARSALALSITVLNCAISTYFINESNSKSFNPDDSFNQKFIYMKCFLLILKLLFFLWK